MANDDGFYAAAGASVRPRKRSLSRAIHICIEVEKVFGKNWVLAMAVSATVCHRKRIELFVAYRVLSAGNRCSADFSIRKAVMALRNRANIFSKQPCEELEDRA